MLFKRLLPCAALLALAALPAPARPAEEKKPAEPGFVIRVQSIDDLTHNFRYLAGLVGREEEAKQIEGWLKAKAGGPKGLEGIDAKRPLAVYGYFDEGGVEKTSAVALIPIADEKAFLGLIENLDAKAEKDKDGVYEVKNSDLPVPVYFRFAHRYAYATALNKDALDKDRLLLPGVVLPPGKVPVLSVTVRIEQIPEKVRDLAVSQVEAQLDAAREEKKEDETPAQHRVKGEILGVIKKYTVSVIKEGGHVALRLDVDEKSKELSAELAVTGKEGTALARDIAALGQRKSLVAGLVGPDSVLNFTLNLPNDDKFAAAMQEVLKDAVRRDIAKEENKEKKEQAEKLFKAFEPAIVFTDADWAIDLRGPKPSGTYTLVSAMKVANGATAEKALRDAIAQLPEKERAQFKLDAAKAGDVAIHSLTMKSSDEGFKKAFGDGPIYLAIRSDAAFAVAGEGALETLKEALKVEPKVSQPLQFEVSVGRVAEAMAKEQPQAPKAAGKAFGKGKDDDKIRVSLEAGHELKVRFVMRTPVLHFFHLMEPGTDGK
jgi:hypothetical protein